MNGASPSGCCCSCCVSLRLSSVPGYFSPILSSQNYCVGRFPGATYRIVSCLSILDKMFHYLVKITTHRLILSVIYCRGTAWWWISQISNRSYYVRIILATRSKVDSPQGKIFLSSTVSRPALGPTQPPIQSVPGAVSPGSMRPEREADHLHQMPWSRKVELYLHFPICLHGIVLN
jgi:hypothetical protein